METQKFDIFFQNFEIDEIEFCLFPESPYPKKRNLLGFIYISPTLLIDMSMERSSQVATSYSIETQNYIFFSKNFKIDKIEFCPYLEKRNRPRLFNISPTLVIDTTMGMSL